MTRPTIPTIPTSSTIGEKLQLKRVLGPWMAMSVVVGNVIGSGIFLKPGVIATHSTSFALIISVWVAGGALCILGALCLSELSTMLPEAGGPYVYIREAYGKLTGFLFGWTELLFLRPASIGALATAFVGALVMALNWRIPPAVEVGLAIALILAMSWINIVGVVYGGGLQLTTTLIKAGFLVLIALSPFLLAPWAGWTLDANNYRATPRDFSLPLSARVAAILLSVMWAYDGWYGITPLAEEVNDPKRNLPLALFGGVGVLMVLYIAVNFAYHGVMSNQEMAAAKDHAAEEMLLKLAGPTGKAAMSAVIMCSVFGAINSNLLLAPRIIFAMGRDKVFFQSLGEVHVNYRTPVIAILTTASLAIGLIIAVSVGKHLAASSDLAAFSWEMPRKMVASLQTNSTFTLLTNMVIFAGSVFYMLAVAALIVLRIRRPHADRPYRTWGYPWTPVVFSVVYLWFLYQVYWAAPLESQAGLLCIALGVPAFFAYQIVVTNKA